MYMKMYIIKLYHNIIYYTIKYTNMYIYIYNANGYFCSLWEDLHLIWLFAINVKTASQYKSDSHLKLHYYDSLL